MSNGKTHDEAKKEKTPFWLSHWSGLPYWCSAALIIVAWAITKGPHTALAFSLGMNLAGVFFNYMRIDVYRFNRRMEKMRESLFKLELEVEREATKAITEARVRQEYDKKYKV